MLRTAPKKSSSTVPFLSDSVEDILKLGEKNQFSNSLFSQLVKLIATVIVLISVLVMYGWILNVELLKSFLPDRALMNFIVATLFFVSGIELFFITRSVQGHKEVSQVVFPATSIFILLIASTILTASVIKIQTGIETLLLDDSQISADVTVSKVQEVPSMISFIIFALVGILTLMNFRRLNLVYFFAGFLFSILGILAILGHLFNVTLLYYNAPGISAPMSVSVAVMFILLGMGLVLTALESKRATLR
ncbi:MAG: hypothetical protein NUV69_01365 [Candidatus Curtissbacteria bacterium]|nr:hypothetical protein [Candidatus Curtissbacteria bacterium]